MATQAIKWDHMETKVDYDQKIRQHDDVMNHLMKRAFGDPQVHRRMHANADFSAGLKALDPHLPEFVEDESVRNVIKTGCVQMIDHTAALLKFARENNIKIVS